MSNIISTIYKNILLIDIYVDKKYLDGRISRAVFDCF